MTTRTLQHTHVEYQNGMKTGNHVVRTHANTHTLAYLHQPSYSQAHALSAHSTPIPCQNLSL